MLSNFMVAAMLPAKDYERAKKFYQDKLGLKKLEDDPGGAVFECGDGTKLNVYPSGFAGTNQATAAGWLVDDIEAEVKELRDRGVTFEEYDMPEIKTSNGIAALGDEKAAWFKDTEGNILSLFQRA